MGSHPQYKGAIGSIVRACCLDPPQHPLRGGWVGGQNIINRPKKSEQQKNRTLPRSFLSNFDFDVIRRTRQSPRPERFHLY